MSMTPKSDSANAESVRRQHQLKRLMCVPLPFLRWCFGLLKRVFVNPSSPTEVRAADKEHQAQVRRELRGLPPVHDTGKHSAAAPSGEGPS
jgi:hypothetical protein